MSQEKSRPIIVIRRPKRRGGGHHGGAWKIAYADFVTAMMAFFLLMWLLGSTTKGQLQGIAEYFQTPLKVALAGGSGSGDSSSIIKGGGRDLSAATGQVKNGELPTERRTINLDAAQAELTMRETESLKALKSRVDTAIETKASLRRYRNQILVSVTSEGLRVQVVDEQNRPMFATGQSEVLPHTREILREIGKILNEVPNRIALSGHTDDTPYAAGERSYSNWELSVDRANASRRELIAGGMDEKKILRVVGLASAVALDAGNPSNPINRRISIIVMKRSASDAAVAEGAAGVDIKAVPNLVAPPPLNPSAPAGLPASKR